jgi:hypothetical protein
MCRCMCVSDSSSCAIGWRVGVSRTLSLCCGVQRRWAGVWENHPWPGQSPQSNVIGIAEQRASKMCVMSWRLDQEMRKPGKRGWGDMLRRGKVNSRCTVGSLVLWHSWRSVQDISSFSKSEDQVKAKVTSRVSQWWSHCSFWVSGTQINRDFRDRWIRKGREGSVAPVRAVVREQQARVWCHMWHHASPWTEPLQNQVKHKDGKVMFTKCTKTAGGLQCYFRRS